jgi:hypothetical protein
VLGLAVGFRRVRFRVGVANAPKHAKFIEDFGAIARSVVYDHALDLDAKAFVPGDLRLQESHGEFLPLALADLAEGQAQMVIDAQLPANASGAALAVALPGDVMTDTIALAQLLMPMRIISPGRSRS